MLSVTVPLQGQAIVVYERKSLYQFHQNGLKDINKLKWNEGKKSTLKTLRQKEVHKYFGQLNTNTEVLT